MEWLNNQYVILSLIAAIFVFLPSYIKSIKFAYYINNVYETTLRQYLTNEELIKYFLKNLKPRIVSSVIIFFGGTPKDMTPFVKNREVLDDSFRLVLEIIKILEEEHNESDIETYYS
ncbi:MAG: hypothetical protein RBT49_08715 [Bacteroidales bacterium]|jgi:hypothetical protein|nr:hypothetical protein [Bacteroidales bacterium]